MLLSDRIQKLEKLIVQYFIDKDEKRVGWTVLQNIKIGIDYTLACDDGEDWNIEYFKQLVKKADELGIKR